MALISLPGYAVAVSGNSGNSGISGTFSHGNTVTLTGTGFGSKTTAAPSVWDDCSGTDPLNTWDGGWPLEADQPLSTPRYAASGSIGSVATAHTNVSNYLAARAYDATASGEGFPSDTMVWTAEATAPQYVYASWYQRVHPSYNSGDNFKWYGYSGGTSPYDSSGSWYLEYAGGLGGTNHINDNAAGLFQDPSRCDGISFGRDYLCNNWYFGGSTNPNSQWVKLEVLINVSSSDTVGWVDLFEDGVRQIDLAEMGYGPHSYNGATDQTITGSPRNVGIGGFTRTLAADNWRFFNDLYVDYSFSRVILGDNEDYDSCTVREVQIPSSWAATEIQFTVNLGTFTSGTAYLHVIDSTNTIVSTTTITIGA